MSKEEKDLGFEQKSMFGYQLDMFKESSDWDVMISHISNLEMSMHKVRRGLFGRFGDLYKRYMDMEARLEKLEKTSEK